MHHRIGLSRLKTSLLTALILLSSLVPGVGAERPVQLEQGAHVSIIGNTLAERMQHDGWLETLLQATHPGKQLVIRNMGFSGDELTLRLRSSNFGSPDDWLSKNQTDIVFAFFGYNESYAGDAGLEKFKSDLANFITHTKGQKYNGESAPQLVLFSPIGHENLNNPDLPDGSENNHRLQVYSAAMAEVAAAHDVPFVDLLRPSLDLYATSEQPLTFNGVHLVDRGNQAIAEVIVQSLHGSLPAVKSETLNGIRRAVKEKNFYWFNRYRTTDGFSIYGGRAGLKFVDGQTNKDVMDREMEILEVMTANRDRGIWGAAQGKQVPIDDSNLPPFIPVVTNKPGSGPEGQHLYLTGEQAIELMTVAEGMRVELVADETMFPELINPVQMAFDPQGRLFVGCWESYPHWKPTEQMDDKLLILIDEDGDGRAETCKTFAGGLHNPTGFEFWNGGVLVGMAPDVLFLKDTDGDDVADVWETVLHGIDSADTHHTANSFCFSPGGALHFQEGTFHHTQIESPWKAPVRSANAGVFRFEPRTQKVDCYVAFGFANPHGHVFDRWGQDFVHDGTGAVPYHSALFSGHLNFPQKHSRPPTLYQQRTRPCPATEILSSSHFPDDMQGDLLVQNVIGFQGILRYKFSDSGASFSAVEQPPLLSSTDPNFRPVDLEVGPDGAIYFVDWQNPVIGHMQHNLRDPSRDRQHGRVYRIVYPEREFITPVKIHGEPVEKLVALLTSSEDRVRYRAKIELSGRPTTDVLAAVNAWLANLDENSADFSHHLCEALWVHQFHNVVNQPLLERVLNSSDFRARAAGTNVLCYWRDRIPDTLERLHQLVQDQHPRVRLEAVRAASFLTEPAAIEIPLVAAELDTDQYLTFVIQETLKTLEPQWSDAKGRGEHVALKTDAGRAYALRTMNNTELLQQDRSRPVYREMLYRSGLQDDVRREAIQGLAKLDKVPEVTLLLNAIKTLTPEQQQQSGLVFDLVRLLTMRSASELQSVRQDLTQMAKAGELPIVRQVGYAALIAADGNAEAAWKMAVQNLKSLADLLNAVPYIPDPSVRAQLYPRVEELLVRGLPEHLAPKSSSTKGTLGQYVRISLPGNRRTLTLAEVEVMVDGANVARTGKATQNATGHGGVAERAIDGNTNSSYGSGTQTHTPENRPDPWWEVDLRQEYPIESVHVYNRNEGSLGQRLEGFTLTILGSNRETTFEQKGIPAPQTDVSIEIGGTGPVGLIRRAAMNSLPAIRGHEADTFKLLAKFIAEDTESTSAMIAIQRIPRRFWPETESLQLANSLLDLLEKIPANLRTSPHALNALQLGDSLTAVVPTEDATRIRKQLGELGVRVIRLGTVPHQMAFDRERMAVQAGKPVEFIFENSDIMPHNFAITRPGTMAAIGELAEATARDPQAAQRHYVPQSKDVLLSSRLLQTREADRMSWTAPKEPGVYPYVCTYPGHWRRMYGALYVVADLEAYEANPEEYVQQHSLEARDELLAYNRPRKDWTLDELATAVSEVERGGRSFGNGKQIFTVANCIACHRLNDVGIQIGQDLSKLDPQKMPPLEIVKHILDPSLRVEDKFATYSFELDSGKVVSGVILKETDTEVQVIENPLAKSEPLVISKKEIVEQVKSPVSLMPKGLLSKLTLTEILDLTAYVSARGHAADPVFQSHD